MYELDPDSAAELDELCRKNPKAEKLRDAVERVCANPSGQFQPKHKFSQKFKNAKKYVTVAPGATVWEFKPNQWRGLYMTVEDEIENENGEKQTIRLLVFIPIKGRRFLTVGEAPWH